MAAISINGLSKRYGMGKTVLAAVKDFSIEIADGEFVTLLGPSGCGKSTTLRLVAGYVRPDGGSIRVGDRLLSSPDSVVPPEARGMGMVFQNYAVWPHKSVAENVVFGLRVQKVSRGEAQRRVERILDIVGLAGLGGRFPNELSGGQQQRVALARSLVVEPTILLLDEPLSNLDAKLREHMRAELKALQRRTGITFVYVTHDQAEALALSDRIAVMHRGVLQQYGAPREIYAKPANRIVADFMGLVNLLPATIAAVNGGSARVAASGFHLDLALPPGLAAGDAAEIAIRPESIRFVAPGGSAGVAAQVAEQTYLGNLSEYRLVLAGGETLRVQAPAAADHPVGATVAIAVDAAQCNLFPKAAPDSRNPNLHQGQAT
ncbi:MAG: transporter related protein [Rhodospirillales bacterium]|jgi:iron(III) transport system ATP-binding protein|nr:transporter related protein [Rhodospirillales bacterium]